jgi:hypothetical protein
LSLSSKVERSPDKRETAERYRAGQPTQIGVMEQWSNGVLDDNTPPLQDSFAPFLVSPE